jgi:phage-related protein
MPRVEKRVRFWPASLQEDLYNLHEDAREAICQALQDAKLGVKSPMAKPHGEDKRLSGVMKIVKDAADGNTYRGIYTVEFPEAVWVIDVYDKKAKSGISTPKPDIDRAVGRLKNLRDYRTNSEEGKKLVEALLKDLRAREDAARKQMEKHYASSTDHAKKPR